MGPRGGVSAVEPAVEPTTARGGTGFADGRAGRYTHGMVKEFVQRVVRRAGYHVNHVDRFGVDAFRDLERMFADRPPEHILDVGANVGQTARLLTGRFPRAQVYSFEPVPATFAELEANTAGLPRVTAVNQGMGSEAGRATINLYATSLHSSMLTAGRPSTASVEVDVSTVDAFCTGRSISRVDLLKVDVEGFEAQVLRGAGTVLREGRVRFVYLECRFAHSAELPQGDFFELHNLLTPLGYCLAGVYPESFNLKHGALHANVLFAHRASLPARVPGKTQNITTYG